MRRFAIYFVIANLIGVFFLWLAAKELPFEKIIEFLGTYDTTRFVAWSIAFCALYSLCHFARVVRWYELASCLNEEKSEGREDEESDDPQAVISKKQAASICAIGFMAILLLPLRLGEFVRPYLLSKKSGVSMTAALGTVVVERVIDGMVITGMLFITASTYAFSEQRVFALSLAAFAAAIFFPAFFMCSISLWKRELAFKITQKTLGLFSEKLASKVTDLLGAFIDGFKALKNGSSLGKFLAFTTLYWVANGGSMWLLARFAFGFDVSLFDGYTLLAILVVGIMLPAGPAMAGNYEYFINRGMLMVSTTAPEGIAAFAATIHVLQFLVIVIPGMLIMAFDKSMRSIIKIANESMDAVE